MGKIEANKISAARRQIDAAIRMLFSGEDPIAIHTVAMAAFRLLRDLAGQSDDNYIDNVIKGMIIPGKEKEFWRQFNAPANFLKHADRDPDGYLEGVDEEVNDGILFIATPLYQSLGNKLTPEMMTLVIWQMALHPEFIRDEAPSAFKKLALEAGSEVLGKSRKEQLSIGKRLLVMAQNHNL